MRTAASLRGVGGYYSIRGRDLWVEDRGGRSVREGTPPLLLLHGGLDHSGSLLGVFDDNLRARYRLTAFDRSGCGRSPMAAGCFTFADKADQVIAFIEDYLREPAHLIGYSDGGNAALTSAARRPDLVSSMTLIGANFHHGGLISDVMPPMDAICASYAGSETAKLCPEGVAQAARNAADTWRMWASEPTFNASDLHHINTPALILAGDDEPIDPHHTVTMYESLPVARLAIVPGASHALPLEKPGLVAQLIGEFLDDPHNRATQMPVRR